MIDLTPLDVRKKRGDFGRGVRGYNPQEVDGFLELVAERLEELVKENITLRERAERLTEQVSAQTGREQAVQQALVTAQQLREEIQMNAQKEAELVVQEARARGREVLAAAERQAAERTEGLQEIERRRLRFLASYRQFIEKELDHIAAEEGKAPLEEVRVVELDLGEERTFRYDRPPLPGAQALSEDTEVFPSLVEGAPEGGESNDEPAKEEPRESEAGWVTQAPPGSEAPAGGWPAPAELTQELAEALDEADAGDEKPDEPEEKDPSSRWMPDFPGQGATEDD
jgi:cell division initiation protein